MVPMSLRSMRRELKKGSWVLVAGSISGLNDFQTKRITEAVSAARIYLRDGQRAKAMANATGVTAERMAQIIRLGISWMVEQGWLRPIGPAPRSMK